MIQTSDSQALLYDCGKVLGNSDLIIYGHADANWGGDRNDQKLTTSYIFFTNNRTISWASHQQTTVALSIIEVE